MSRQALPILFLNMSGEMMYIIEQRLHAQNVNNEKSGRVLQDIIGLIFKPRFMDEVFKPQELYSKKAMRTIFERLSHASIMRLNEASMDKLYDLIVMAVKYQVLLSLRPRDLMLVTLNHLDAMKVMIKGNGNLLKDAEYVHKLLMEHYNDLYDYDWMMIRQALLNFFQDSHVRVSVFLREKSQNSNGRFVLPAGDGGPLPYQFQAPAKMRLYARSGEVVEEKSFDPHVRYVATTEEGSWEFSGNRVTKLGLNIYKNSPSAVSTETVTSAKSTLAGRSTLAIASDFDENVFDPNSKQQLDCLANLIGPSPTYDESAKSLNNLTMSLFDSAKDESDYASAKPVFLDDTGQVVRIDPKKMTSAKQLSAIMHQMNIDLTVTGPASSAGDDDLLALMDEAGT